MFKARKGTDSSNAMAPQIPKMMMTAGKAFKLISMHHLATLGIIVFVLGDQLKSTRFTWKPKIKSAP